MDCSRIIFQMFYFYELTSHLSLNSYLKKNDEIKFFMQPLSLLFRKTFTMSSKTVKNPLSYGQIAPNYEILNFMNFRCFSTLITNAHFSISFIYFLKFITNLRK